MRHVSDTVQCIGIGRADAAASALYFSTADSLDFTFHSDASFKQAHRQRLSLISAPYTAPPFPLCSRPILFAALYTLQIFGFHIPFASVTAHSLFCMNQTAGTAKTLDQNS